jgi:hypothetical protein
MIYANLYADGRVKNSLFELEDTVHRFNPSYTPRLLRSALLERGIELNTPDLNAGRSISFDLHLEGRALGEKIAPRYLIALENPNINKLNASSEYCSQFDLVFAWDKRLHHLANLVPILIPHPMQIQELPGPEQRHIFSCLINANKAFKEELENDLYRERLSVIRWYERHAPEFFQLYGLGWEKHPPAYTLSTKLTRAARQLNSRLRGVPAFPSFRGEIADKSDILRRSRFSYCYENNKDIPNYITEKMLDSLINGCVPVYWGADNITQYVPATCFIDRRQFPDTAAVHRHLLSIDDGVYLKYQQAIGDFLSSQSAQEFSSNRVVHTIVEHICENLLQHIH